ncbi:folylpolyglutamate synthase isoform X5 [Manihot esculenta]|uniref:Uncharacterized protein n=3 Tax=Manihot esculenta TaxID=3983 RepID=A0ACB7H1Q3_MANES|nr:folylpolyglutamate synthase isoform X5 [Manihot esculenta]KAG8646573.1 hypothetical protein MANES_09G016200v8 [Manihot esculenta]KAG8646574.1 hypothetical protein MANES_09G016200v8 [Manihot esculenta]
MFSMFVYTNNYLKCGIVRVSHFHEREYKFSTRAPCKYSFQPAFVGTHDLIDRRKLHFQARGSKYHKMSSQVMEKTESNVAVEDSLRDLPLSNSYETAMEALSSLITRQKRGTPSSVGGKYGKFDRMQMYLKILNLEEHIPELKIIHVAGTKGKGSTCAFCEAILRECGFRTGLFTSPHLIDVRERFRIDGFDISEDKFLLHFWDCWNQLKEHVSDDLPMPPLFQFLTVLAFKIFVCEKVDVAIIEVGLGGKRDSTNVIKEPVVCGITPLGMDHTEVLGNTLGCIASHKAGIFKDNPESNMPEAFLRGLTTAHLYGRAQVVHDSSSNCHFGSAPADNSSGDLIFYLDGAHSPESMEVCAKWFSSAVQESKQLPNLSSSSHDVESMKEVWGNGYIQSERGNTNESNKISKKILLFNCMEVRDPQILLPQLVSTCASSGTYFSKAIFVPSISTYNKVTSGTSAIPSGISNQDLSWQFSLQRLWEKIIHGIEGDVVLDESSKLDSAETLPPREFLYEDASRCSPADGNLACSSVISSLPLTIKWLRDCVRENPTLRIRVLVTGSLHLVGDVLKLLKR